MKILQNAGVPAILMFMGAIISATGAIWAAYRQADSDEKLNEKSEEIAALNKQIAMSITGGDSFAYLIPTFPSHASKSAILTLLHEGEYPLYDMNARVVDLFKFENSAQRPFPDRMQDDVHLVIGNVAQKSARLLGPMQINGEVLRWNIFFSARNGFFDELLRVRRVANEWKVALKVIRRPHSSTEPVIVFEKIDPGYPLGKGGQVEWD